MNNFSGGGLLGVGLGNFMGDWRSPIAKLRGQMIIGVGSKGLLKGPVGFRGKAPVRCRGEA